MGLLVGALVDVDAMGLLVGAMVGVEVGASVVADAHVPKSELPAAVNLVVENSSLGGSTNVPTCCAYRTKVGASITPKSVFLSAGMVPNVI